MYEKIEDFFDGLLQRINAWDNDYPQDSYAEALALLPVYEKLMALLKHIGASPISIQGKYAMFMQDGQIVVGYAVHNGQPEIVFQAQLPT